MQFKLERQGMEKKFFDLCTKVVSENGFHLYGLDYRPGQKLLCLFIENPETKTANLEDCVKVDRAMTPYVEEEEWMPSELTLEVSSPGVYRDIYEGHQFEELVGKRIKFALLVKVDQDMVVAQGGPKELKPFVGQKKFDAYLVNFEDETLTLSPTLEGMGKFAVKLDQIKKANVEPMWEDIKEN